MGRPERGQRQVLVSSPRALRHADVASQGDVEFYFWGSAQASLLPAAAAAAAAPIVAGGGALHHIPGLQTGWMHGPGPKCCLVAAIAAAIQPTQRIATHLVVQLVPCSSS